MIKHALQTRHLRSEKVSVNSMSLSLEHDVLPLYKSYFPIVD
jgi:hypothetical protein